MSNFFDQNQLQDLQRHLSNEIFQGKSMSISQLHGFCCALISSPRDVPSNQWLPVVFGGTPTFTSVQQEQEVTAAVLQFYHEVMLQLEHADEVMPLIDLDANQDYAELTAADVKPWCDAYTQAVDLAHHEWFSTGHNDIYQIVFPIVLLADHVEEQTLAQLQQQYSIAEIHQRCLQALPKSIVHAFHFWRQHQHCGGHHHHHQQQPVRNAQEKVGRNDPCPCGSQKKYKKCCGV